MISQIAHNIILVVALRCKEAQGHTNELYIITYTYIYNYKPFKIDMDFCNHCICIHISWSDYWGGAVCHATNLKGRSSYTERTTGDEATINT